MGYRCRCRETEDEAAEEQKIPAEAESEDQQADNTDRPEGDGLEVASAGRADFKFKITALERGEDIKSDG